MSPFVFASFWGFVPGLANGFTTPKIAVILTGFVVYTLVYARHYRPLTFLAVCTVSALYGIYPEVSFWGVPTQWSQGVFALAFYCLLLTVPPKTDEWLKWAGVALSVHCILQYAGFDPVLGIHELHSGRRASAWVGSPVDLGAILAMAAPLAGAWLPLLVAGILATGSRGALVAVAFALAPARVRWLLAPLILAGVLLAPAPKDMARRELSHIAWRGFVDAPWIGNGPGTFYVTLNRKRTTLLTALVGEAYMQTNAHNDILEALCTVGILGLFAYLFMVWPLLRHPSLLALFVNLKFNPVSFEVLCAAALVAATYLKEKETK